MSHRVLAVCLAFAVCSSGARAQPTEAMRLPLLSKDPKHPVTLLADKDWGESQIRIQPRNVTGTPADLPRSSRQLKLEPIKLDSGMGPATLVVDLAGYLIDPSDDAEAALRIDIECPEAPNGCAYPILKSVLPFRSAFMARQEVPVASGKRTVVVGRESHAYTLPADTPVEFRVALLEPKNLEPLELTTRLIYGEYERRALPGQTTRSGLLWKIIAGAVVLLLAVFWWLRRS